MKQTITTELAKARKYEKEAPQKKKMLPKPIFHVAPPIGWINDPNGFSEYQGEIHLFYQYHPYDTVWGPMHWGHVKSSDFVKWQQLPAALAPDTTADSFGCFSGTAISHGTDHILAYAGVIRENAPDGSVRERQQMCIAIGDGTDYVKLPENPVIDERMLPEGAGRVDFRDPKIWEEDGAFYLIAVNRSADGSGQVLKYSSRDLKNWTYEGIYDACKNRIGRMWECPDLFDLGEKKVLLLSPQEVKGRADGMHPGDNTVFLVGTEESTSGTFREEYLQPADYGLDFYAAQTMETSDGRRILIGWLATWACNWFTPEDGFSGMMTVPRELTWKGHVICQKPVRELENYYTNPVEICGKILTEQGETMPELKGRVQDLELSLTGEKGAFFELRFAAKVDTYTRLTYDFDRRELVYDRKNQGMTRDCENIRVVQVPGEGYRLDLRILLDLYSSEIFVQGGEITLTNVMRSPLECEDVRLFAKGRVQADITKHDICVN